MLEFQMHVLAAWYAAGDRLRTLRARAAEDRDRGEVTAQTVLIVVLVVAALAAGGVIAAKITGNADKIPDP